MGSTPLWISSLTLSGLMAQTAPIAQDIPDTRVTGGSRAKPCAWPSVMLLGVHAPKTGKESGCTGTLVHPELILYAAHCGKPYVIIFGEDRKGKRVLKKNDFAKIGRYPRWQNDSMTHVDWAYVRLKEPITDMPTTPVVAGCEYDKLQKNGAPVIFSGYSTNNSKSQDAIILRWANTRITSISNGKINAGGQGTTACPGDSGGPMLAKLPDNSWRTVGIASTISDLSGCGKAGVWNSYAQVRRAMIEWVESDSGIDITPCFDLDGQPTPGEACDRFRAYAGNPNAPKGKRENSCVESLTVRAGDFCEVPKTEEPEPEPEPEPDDTTSTTGEDGSESTSTGSDSQGEDTDSKEGTSSSDNSGSEEEEPEPKESEENNTPEPETSPEASPQDSPEDSNLGEEGSAELEPEPEPKRVGGCQVQDSGGPLASLMLLCLGLFGYRRKS